MQEQALRILTAAAEGKTKIKAGASLRNRLLPTCLAALSAPSQSVRQQALALCSAAAASETAALISADELVSGSTVKELMVAIVLHATAIEADPAAAVALLRHAHAPSGKQKKAIPARYALDDAEKRLLPVLLKQRHAWHLPHVHALFNEATVRLHCQILDMEVLLPSYRRVAGAKPDSNHAPMLARSASIRNRKTS